MLSIENMTVRYGAVVAVNDVSFNLTPGAITGLIGPNGAGKTSLIDAVCGFTPAEGRVVFDGEDISRMAPSKRARTGIARSFQTLELFEDATVFENISVAADPQDMRSYVRDLVAPSNPPFPPEVVRAIIEFQLDGDLHRDVKDLSYGKHRLLAIARAVAMHPSVLLFRKMGIHRVHAIDELVDTLATLSAIGPLRGNRMVSLSCSGGEAALVADRSQGRNLSVPQFAPDHAARVASALDGRVAITNPLDYHTYIWGDLDRLSRCFASVLGADATPPGTTAHGETHTDTAGGGSGEAPFDAAMLVLDFPAEGLDRSRWWPTMQAFATACANGDTPGVVAASLAENLPDEARSQAAEWGLAACGDIDNALSALEAAAAWGRHLDDTEPEAGLLVVKAREAPLGTSVLPEHEAKPRLAAAGIEVPMGRLVEPQQAAAAADEIGYPVAVKAVGTAHKSDAGGVAVGLTDAESVAAAAGRIAASVGAPTAVGVRAVMVELCITDVVAELLVSVRSSPPVGMVLTVGAGGTLTEVLDDTASLLLPAGGDTLEALRDLRLWPVLAGYRGRPAGAVDAVVNTVKLLETLVRDDDRIIEVEVNPLLVTPHTAVAADALMVLAND